MWHTPLSRLLRQARHHKGLTQAELGRRLHMPQGHISVLEQGKTDPRLSTIIEMARHLDSELILVPRAFLPQITSILEGKDLSATPMWDIPDEEE